MALRARVVLTALMLLTFGAATIRPAYGQGSPPDSSGDQPFDVEAFFADDGEPARTWITPFGDLRLRGDFVTGLPGGREDLRRGRVTLRAGVRIAPLPVLDADVSFRASVATDHNDDRRRNFDNETPDALELDRAAVRLTPRPHWTVTAGKSDLPLLLTAMTWDDDLRPAGVFLAGTESWGAISYRLSAAFARALRFPGDEASVQGGQLTWRFRDASPTGLEAAIAYLGFTGLDEDVREGLARQNSVQVTPPPELATEFGLVDVQVAAWADVFGRRVVARVDHVRNERANPRVTAIQAHGWRVRTAWGDTRALAAIEVGHVYQRVERDAVPGSFNSDDWWFHSADRGHSVWVAVGLGASAFLRVTGFDERRDDLRERTRRLLVELTATLRPD